MSQGKLWHGLTDAEWEGIFRTHDWQEIANCTLRQIASSGDAAPEDRINALSMLNQAIQSKLLPADTDYPQFSCIVMCSITLGARAQHRSWLGRVRKRRDFSERLLGVRNLLFVAQQFVKELPVKRELPEGLPEVVDFTKLPS